MRRWNGWGDAAVEYPMPEGALAFLEQRLGVGASTADAKMEALVNQLPSSGLKPFKGISTDPADRLLHTHGQSLPDWIALRSGQIGRSPDGVAYPREAEQVRELLNYARRKGIQVIPYGGGTSVVGHINPVERGAPVLTLDLGQMNRLLDLDKDSRLARFEAGVNGPALEHQLNQHGYTLGHFPQSWEYSTLGGWIATRSTGQQSYHYGRIEDLFAGGLLETPAGLLPLRNLPASAAGPDLRHAALGSEGRLGVITEASVRIQPFPEQEAFYGIFFRSWEAGSAATRALVQAMIPASMIRLSDAQETLTTLALAGKPQLVRIADVLLRAFGAGEARCLMILGLTANRASFPLNKSFAFEILRAHGGIPTGTMIGTQWSKSRFRSPYLRNTLWEHGYALDTLETAVRWSGLEDLRKAILTALDHSFETIDIPVMRFSHISHVYPDGGSIYVTFIYPRTDHAESTLAIWQDAKRYASDAIVAHKGTISHQHGLGMDHLPYLQAEKGSLGIAALESFSQTFDPQGIMNPGKGWPAPSST
jgi:alkyldihydroxyacetonephosphate synthase